MTTTLRITHEDWETMATASLEGMLIDKGLAENIANGDLDIVLEVEQTSLTYRTENNGPKILLIPEFTMMCIMESIVKLMEKGYKIIIQEVIQDK